MAALLLLPAFQLSVAGNGALQDQLGGLIDIVVAQDGTGDYTLVQDAINAAPDSSEVPTVIFIKNGVYHEKLIVPNEKPNLTLIGEDVDSTVLTYNDRSLLTVELNTFTSHSVRVDASDIKFLNLTIQNPETASQAVALHGNGDRQTFAHCRILGWQDTYYSDMRSRNYFRDCFIEGRTDYIFGFGVALFDSCQIRSVMGAYVTAASTPRYYDFGMVFRNCRFNAAPGAGNYVLGRPWFDYARTVMLDCYESAELSAPGWNVWVSGRDTTCFYAEYRCTGPGSDTSGRVAWSHQLKDSEAPEYTTENIFSADNFPPGDDDYLIYWETRFKNHQTEPYLEDIVFRADGDWPVKPTEDWVPDIESDSVYVILRANSRMFLDSANLDASIASLKLNGGDLPGWAPAVFEYFVELPEGTTEMPVLEAMAANPLSSVEIEYPAAIPGFAGITILANDRASHQSYSIYLSVDGASGNAWLDSILIANVAVPGFDPEIFDYEVILPQGTSKYSPVGAYCRAPDTRVNVSKPSSFPGTYTIVVTAVDGTTNTYTVNASLAAGTNSLTGDMPVSIFHDPAAGLIRFRVNEDLTGSLQFTLYDLKGSLLLEKSWTHGFQGEYSLPLTEKVTGGLYLYRLGSNDLFYRGRLLINRAESDIF